MTFRLGYQVVSFTYPGGAPSIRDTLLEQAREAEVGGFDAVMVMDHFLQLDSHGALDEPMLECYTTLGVLAAATSRVRLSALVTGNTYRNPALLAKTVTTLDVLSGGRAVLGLGAGWFREEHEAFGFEFGTVTDRFQRLEEALSIITPMLAGERPTVEGVWYGARDALNEPRLGRVPVLLGGSGEQKTFRLAARFADHLNLICPYDVIDHKVRVLAQRCEEAGRDPATLATSFLVSAVPVEAARDVARVRADLTPYMQEFALVGTPEHIAGRVAEEVLGRGVGGVVVNLPTTGHVRGTVRAVAEALLPVLGATGGGGDVA
ncbi:LLM class F420-dependent oxidoreductase [Aquipuribacter nitratireducens]|uniref:LLM class F420-dependent oxidoreductase n=1 Tax=Aquipuribacter nitratireducens TaxID=650104 RepID=A0ABW0GHP5_9MICO